MSSEAEVGFLHFRMVSSHGFLETLSNGKKFCIWTLQRIQQTVFVPEATSDLLNVCFLSLQHILIVQRQLTVLEDELDEFRLALRQYMECACAQTGCLQSVHILFHYFWFLEYLFLFVLVRLSKVYLSYPQVTEIYAVHVTNPSQGGRKTQNYSQGRVALLQNLF